jgi:hypothetical protein
MNYTYEILEDMMMDLEVYEYQNGNYHFHSTIFGLKKNNEMEEIFENKNDEYLYSLKRMKKWVLENYPELLL